MDRREFLQAGFQAWAWVFLAPRSVFLNSHSKGPPSLNASGAPDIAVVAGEDRGKAVSRAVELLGGMEKFIPKGSRVALLANVQSNHPGTFTKPEIARAVIRLCRQAGAKEVNFLSWQPLKNWEATGLAKVATEEEAGLKIFDRNEANFQAVPIPAGKALKEARILAEFFHHDILINMPITKDHVGNKFTGTMKNLMGLNSPASNRTFHKENWQTDLSAIEHLDQCIADLNTAIAATLCIVDATEFITTNGPFGPGELLKPKKVVVGTDPVAVDTYCARLWGLKPENIFMLQKGYEHKLGEVDLKNVKIQEISL